MPWNTILFDATGKIKDARVGGGPPPLTVTGTPVAETTTASGNIAQAELLTATGTPAINTTAASGIIGENVFASFPRLGHYAQGGWGGTGMDARGGLFARCERLGKYDYVIVGTGRTWHYNGIDGSFRLDDLVALIKSFSIIDTKVIHYVDVPDIVRTGQLPLWNLIRNKLATETGPNGSDWYLRDENGCNVTSFPTVRSDCPPSSASTWRTNHSELVIPDANGWRYPTWFANAWHANASDVGDWVTGSGFGIRSEYGFEGVFLDVMAVKGKVTADWDQDGFNENRNSVQVIDWVTKGHVEHVDAWRALEPSFLIMGNYASQIASTTDYDRTPPRFFDLLEGPNSEHLLGRSFSHETFGNNENAIMLAMKRMMSFNAVSRAAGIQGYELFDGANAVKPASYSETDWVRYALCICLQDDCWLSMKDDVVLTGWPLIANEYDLNMGSALQLPNYGATPSGYNSFQNGVYKREYFNSATGVGYIALFNPKDNGQQIITLPVHSGFQWNRLGIADFPGGVDDPDVNDGATNILTQTMDARTGIIIKRQVI